MKTKVTLTIDKEVLPKAKVYARTHGSSLSQLIENSLIEMGHKQDQSFSMRWRGKFEKSKIQTLRYKVLGKRYF